MVWANAERFGGTIGFRRRIDGSWVDVTAREFAAQVLDVAKGMIAAGLRPGDRIALYAATRYEWTLFDFAVWAAGCRPCRSTATAPAEESSGSCPTPARAGSCVETADAPGDGAPDRRPAARARLGVAARRR